MTPGYALFIASTTSYRGRRARCLLTLNLVSPSLESMLVSATPRITRLYCQPPHAEHRDRRQAGTDMHRRKGEADGRDKRGGAHIRQSPEKQALAWTKPSYMPHTCPSVSATRAPQSVTMCCRAGSSWSRR